MAEIFTYEEVIINNTFCNNKCIGVINFLMRFSEEKSDQNERLDVLEFLLDQILSILGKKDV
ncbi:hypothetical protein R9X47_09370 [Wukongibacter baidiensis]|uniref:hypothetical protein n=1 Tax=Wukongibacter baidiensis TaxID=1723361 RepID=UPI003D7FB694